MRWLRSLPFMVLLCAAGCATMQQPITIPPHLLMVCPEPAMRVLTNGEMASTLNNYHWALRACNDDKAALREGQKD